MRIVLRAAAAAILAAVGVGSCATASFAAREATVLSVVALINSPDPTGIQEISTTPFLLDAEILSMPSDVRDLWAFLSEAGFAITDAVVVATSQVTPGSYMQFSNSMDARVFFESSLPLDTVIARIRADEGEFVLLLAGRRGAYPGLLGFKGPIR